MKRSNQGYALLSVVGIVGALLVAGVGTLQRVRTQLHYTADQVALQTAYHLAEAGVERGLAQLDHDAATAATAAYVHPTIPAGSLGGGTYTVTLAQDPLYASPIDPTRKLITAIGTFNGQQATVVAHALVQPPQDPCSQYIVFAESGDARLLSTVGVSSDLFDGNVFSNQDAEISLLASAGALGFRATGNVTAVGNFINHSTLGVLSNLSATLLRGGAYTTPVGSTHAHVPIVGTPLLGMHFSNGSSPSGDGAQTTVASRTLPVPDWDRAKRSATVIVNDDNYATVVPGSSWTANDIWNVNTWSLNPNARYYVDGSVNVVGLQLASGLTAEIWARGRIAIKRVSLLAIGGTQSLFLIGENDVAIGRE
ncbi:MAG: hypothetical protein ACREQQ_05705, partial [Candidatus Binatia bacterium]